MQHKRLAFLACLSALCLSVTIETAAQSRTGGSRTSGSRTTETRTGVTPAEEAVVFHAMLVLSSLENQRIGPVVSGRSAIVRCDDCGPFPGDPEICTALRDEVNAAAIANAEAGKMLDFMQAALEAYNSWLFWSGVGDMVAQMIGAATTILTAGVATGPVLAAAQVLIQMGKEATVDAVVEALADQAGIDLSAETAMQDMVSYLNGIRKETNDRYQSALAAWLACRGRRAEAIAAVDAWNDCWASRQCWIEEQ